MPETNYVRDKMRRANARNDMTEIMPTSSDGMTEIQPETANEDTAFFRNAEEIKVFIIKSQKTYATVLFFLVGLSISLAIAGIQVTYKVVGYEKRRGHMLHSNLTSNASREILTEATSNIFLFSNIKLGIESLLSVISLATSITLYYYYRTVFLLKKVRNNYSKDTSFVQANPLFKKFIVEGIICALHIPPIVSSYVHPKFQLLVFIRVYLIGRYLQQKHSLMHSQSTRCLARLGNTELTSMFLVKASFRKYPFQMMMFGYTSFVLISTYVVWLLEESFSYFDTMWMLIVAMTTVGYGDLTPKSLLGRFAVSLASLVGILFIAIFCFLASQALILSRTEKRVLAYYESKERARQKKIAALNVIGMWYKYYAYKSKFFPTSESDIFVEYENATASVFTTRQRKEKFCSMKKLKCTRLKTNMCHGITFWRLLRNDPNGPTYNQDFVIEDMKILVHNMSENVDKIFEGRKGSEVDKEKEEDITPVVHDQSDTRGRDSGQMAEDLSFSDRSRSANRKHQEVIPLVKIIPPSRNMQYNIPCPTVRGDNMPTTTQVPRQDIRNPTCRNNVYRPQHNESYECTSLNNSSAAKILEEVLADNAPFSAHDCSQRDKNIMIAFNLMKIQHNILNNAIETIYHKTKHDISDIQQRVNDFVRVTRNNRFNSYNNYETGL